MMPFGHGDVGKTGSGPPKHRKLIDSFTFNKRLKHFLFMRSAKVTGTLAVRTKEENIISLSKVCIQRAGFHEESAFLYQQNPPFVT